MEFDFSAAKDFLIRKGACDRCLGRQFSMMFKGHTTGEIGCAIRKSKTEQEAKRLLQKPQQPMLSKDCPLCGGIFLKTPAVAEKAIELASNYGFKTFLVGAKVPKRLSLEEELTWEQVGAAHCEPLKKDIVREVGSIIEPKLEKAVDFKNPDITILADFTSEEPKVSLQSHPLFIFGKYRKLVSGIPQTKWYCRECRGRGCKRCNLTGKMYEESVEELIAKEPLEETAGSGQSFHGSGREDIDAKMLGWRPFVLEIKEPITRTLRFAELEAAINRSAPGKIEVSGLRESSRDEIRSLKQARHDKTYEATIECERSITPDLLSKIESLFKSVSLSQKTPSRVLHRRSDLVRKRGVVSVSCQQTGEKSFKARIRGEAGLYIKELVSGDGGRTTPSFSEIVGPCKCVSLDVLEVHDHD